MKHKWYNEIVAWASGAEIEARTLSFGGTYTDWYGASSPLWDTGDVEYRIKPQPKEPKYLYVYFDNVGNTQFLYGESRGVTWTFMGKIKLITDNEE